MSQPDQTPWNAVAGIEQNMDLLKRCVRNEQSMFGTCLNLASDMAAAVESYCACRKNTRNKQDREKYRILMNEAVAAYRTSESGQFYTPPQEDNPK